LAADKKKSLVIRSQALHPDDRILANVAEIYQATEDLQNLARETYRNIASRTSADNRSRSPRPPRPISSGSRSSPPVSPLSGLAGIAVDNDAVEAYEDPQVSLPHPSRHHSVNPNGDSRSKRTFESSIIANHGHQQNTMQDTGGADTEVNGPRHEHRMQRRKQQLVEVATQDEHSGPSHLATPVSRTPLEERLVAENSRTRIIRIKAANPSSLKEHPEEIQRSGSSTPFSEHIVLNRRSPSSRVASFELPDQESPLRSPYPSSSKIEIVETRTPTAERIESELPLDDRLKPIRPFAQHDGKNRRQRLSK